ncbi:MAG: hypothetical protein JXL20_11640, partial [Deltaproteobacteria bacterium]|nr:hypothetical protein [Deltaproteobacteria bacterium]
VTARYIHGPGIDEPLAMEKNSQMYYYHADSLGSIIALTDSTGNIMQSYRYDAFGNIMNGAPTITQPYTYTAREYDPETGLLYYRARYYDPKAGRFITRDPIGFAGGINFYVYVANNPLNLIDPSGLACGSGWKQVPDIWFGWYSFEGPCTNHDDCYGCGGKRTGKTRAMCDNEFYQNMRNVCNRLALGYSRNHCESMAITYYNYVRENGNEYFDKARKCCEK